MIPSPSFPPIEEILPHRGTMLLLDRMVEFDEQGTRVEYVPRHDAWYANIDGSMPAWIGLELMAQAAAAHVGMTKSIGGESPAQGALLGTRRFSSTLPAYPVGKALHICATLTYRDSSGLGAYECSIVIGDQEVANAILKVFEPEDFESFLQASFS